MYRFRQGTLNVSEYFTQLKVFWDELEIYRPLPRCTCSFACSCGGVDSAKTYHEQDYAIQFFKGLNECFAHSKSQVMMMNLPDIDKVIINIYVYGGAIAYGPRPSASGGIVRDFDGKFLGAYAKFLGISNFLIFLAIEFAHDEKGWQKIWLESDYMTVVQALKSPFKVFWQIYTR
ncbi:hypothetical protein KIW84_051224 [Lathyrus oleraceus]|uniref:RNase H type-1 domain-containing protein n=1 Tax=Pisum sativum TaxID=3888 RepID=A0A9D5ADL8_PEA|nr:hypothetical protein KIW84_051224 [Pisum sativum]